MKIASQSVRKEWPETKESHSGLNNKSDLRREKIMKTRQRISTVFVLLASIFVCNTVGATIINPPVSDPGGPYTATVGELIPFDGSASFHPDDPFAVIIAFDWDFGDLNTGTGVAPTHAYASPGIFNVSLTVTDDYGNTATALTTAEISAVPVPAAVWLFGSGLIGLVGIARRKKAA